MFEKLFNRNKDTKTDSTETPVTETPVTVEVTPSASGHNNCTCDHSNDVTTTEDALGEPKETEDIKVETPQPPPLTSREMKYLKRANYEKIANNPKFKNAYLIQNKRTGQMAEIRAASAYHACNIIGWKANKVQVLQEREIKEETPVPSEPAVIVPETTGSSTPT